VLRADGSILQTPGYDPTTRVLFEPSTDYPTIPGGLGRADAQAAAEELLEVLEDFPFGTPECKSVWLAGVLTPLARWAYTGPSPLILIDANIRGSGKGLLAQTIGRIVHGAELPVSSYSRDPDELRKRITACCIAGDHPGGLYQRR
jgi:hypothetical protein